MTYEEARQVRKEAENRSYIWRGYIYFSPKNFGVELDYMLDTNENLIVKTPEAWQELRTRLDS